MLERARGRGLNSRRLEGRGGEVAALRSWSRATRAGFEVDVVSEVGERPRVEVRGVAVTGVRESGSQARREGPRCDPGRRFEAKMRTLDWGGALMRASHQVSRRRRDFRRPATIH
ncbi:hypothetical protein CRG98_033146 [Punica granatum]|uniref:Uncharacterized protein n=1 Tax=Punica granatum TaxID=22663 RepID=A0A2I0IR36_PUNGR|nr:hypothetical protein CRG98_033146 [Punica granatum]